MLLKIGEGRLGMLFPYVDGYLKVSKIHTMYYSCWGNKTGQPILLIHGGPGYGSDEDMLEYLDLSVWNVIMYDQRGCGKSTPLGEILDNTTSSLIEDIKQLLDYLSIKKVIIKGSSWGATLAILFAEKYPSYVKSMILSGMFIGNNRGSLLGKYGGFEKFYPEYYKEYLSLLEENEQSDPYKAYYHHILHGSSEEKVLFSRELIKIECITEKIEPDLLYADNVCDSVDVCSVAKIETHYTMNDFFLEPNQLFNNVGSIQDIRISLVHGRVDLITPVIYAWKLAQLLSKCDFRIIESCGHNIDTPDGINVMKELIQEHLSPS